MLGTIVNTCCILLGSAIGSIAKKGLKPKYQEAIFTALGIATVGMGLNAVTQNMPHSSYPVHRQHGHRRRSWNSARFGNPI